jgi:hypothetical protein
VKIGGRVVFDGVRVRHSSINIAAADAPNGETGCFFQRQGAPETIGWKVPVKYERDSDTTSILDCTLPGHYWQASNANILSSRGWVLRAFSGP